MNADLWSNVELVEYADELRTALAGRGVIVAPRFLVPRQAYRRTATVLGRWWLRVCGYAVYPLLLAADFALRRRPAVSIVTTNTFFAPWLASRLAARRRRVVTLVYDLFPEALVVAGKLAAGGLAARAIGAITNDAFRRSAANVFLGRRLLEHATARYGTIPRAAVIPVGAASAAFAEVPPRPRPADARPQILYCGNLGWMHDIDTFAKACLDPADGRDHCPVTVRFHAAGPRLRELQRRLSLPRVGESRTFPTGLTVAVGARLADAEWTDAMLAADVGLVTMTPGSEAVAMPSKAYSAMVAGQAILAVCPLESDLADLVLTHDCGWVIVPEGGAAARTGVGRHPDVWQGAEGLRQVLRHIAMDREALQRKRERAFVTGHRSFSSAAVAEQWHALLRRIVAEPAATGPISCPG